MRNICRILVPGGLALALCGCGQSAPTPIEPVAAQQVARDILDGKIYSSSGAAQRTLTAHMVLLLRNKDFKKLDQLCEAIEKRKAVDPDWSATRTILDPFVDDSLSTRTNC